MYAVVTGAAGFIGSHIAEALVGGAHRVLGIDCFTDAYDHSIKRANIGGLTTAPGFELAEVDLRVADLAEMLEGAEVVFHQAGQPGVRTSFGDGFVDYCDNNVIATQRLLEAARVARVPRVVYASSSSIYGNAPAYPTTEDDLPQPFSPYGVTKLAAEHLCSLYAANWGLSTVALRYFTVYGPRQRPDMAMHRLIDAALRRQSFPLYGQGSQVRDFTYVGDVVAANLAAAEADISPGTVVNISGGSSVTMRDVIVLVEELTGLPITLEHLPAQPGDVKRTGGSSTRAHSLLGWEPKITLGDGLSAQVRSSPACNRIRLDPGLREGD